MGGDAGLSTNAPNHWIREQIRRGKDPLSGADIWQLTSAAAISHDICGAQLSCSKDGKRIAFLRCATTDHRDGPMDLFVADLATKGVKQLGKAVFFLVGRNGRQDAIFSPRRIKGELRITRVNYNSDRTGIAQVYAARIPEELLKELEKA